MNYPDANKLSQRVRLTVRNCGRTLVEQLGDFARTRRISDHVRIYQILDRMKCSACGRRPTGLVSRDPHGT